MRKINWVAVLASLATFIQRIENARAQTLVPPTVIVLDNPLEVSTISGLVTELGNSLVIIAAPIVGAMIIFGAYQIMFAGGDPEKVKSGTRTMWSYMNGPLKIRQWLASMSPWSDVTMTGICQGSCHLFSN